MNPLCFRKLVMVIALLVAGISGNAATLERIKY
jgi:hypothetical protein